MTVLNRLVDLRTTAKLPPKAESPGESGECGALTLQKYPIFKGVHIDEAVARSAYLKLMSTIHKAQQYTDTLQSTQMPSKLQNLTDRIMHEENYCLKQIKHTETLVSKLRGEVKQEGEADAEATQAPVAAASKFFGKLIGTADSRARITQLVELRQNLADLLSAELADASEVLMALRETRRTRQIEQIRRALTYSFPDASKDELQDALTTPELATIAVTRRVEDGDRCPTLDVVMQHLQKSSLGMQRRLEAEAMDLELLFFRFSELVNKGDASLNEIEKNIESTLEETTIAVQNLKEANSLKRGNQNRTFLFRFMAVVISVFLIWYFFGDEIADAWKNVSGAVGGTSSLLQRITTDYTSMRDAVRATGNSSALLEHQSHGAAIQGSSAIDDQMLRAATSLSPPSIREADALDPEEENASSALLLHKYALDELRPRKTAAIIDVDHMRVSRTRQRQRDFVENLTPDEPSNQLHMFLGRSSSMNLRVTP